MTDPLHEERREGPRGHEHARPGARADRVLLRAKDIGLLIGILTIGSFIWKVSAKPAEWNQAAKEVGEMKPIVQRHEVELARNGKQFEAILDELRAINRKIGR